MTDAAADGVALKRLTKGTGGRAGEAVADKTRAAATV